MSTIPLNRKPVMTVGEFILTLENVASGIKEEVTTALTIVSSSHVRSEHGVMIQTAPKEGEKGNTLALMAKVGSSTPASTFISLLRALDNPKAYVLVDGNYVEKIAITFVSIPITCNLRTTVLNQEPNVADLIQHLNNSKITNMEEVSKLIKEVPEDIFRLTLVENVWYQGTPPLVPTLPRLCQHKDWAKLFKTLEVGKVTIYQCRLTKADMEESFGPKEDAKTIVETLLETKPYIDDDGRLVTTDALGYNGGKMITRTVNGMKDGLTEGFCSNGKASSRYNYKNGKRDGDQIDYYKTGTVLCRYHCQDGKVDGIELSYNEDGTLCRERNWKNDELDGLLVEYQNGKPFHEITYADGRRNGVEKQFDSDGKVIKEVIWKNGNIVQAEKVPVLTETTPGRFAVKDTPLIVEKLSTGAVVVVETTDGQPADKDLAKKFGFILLSP